MQFKEAQTLPTSFAQQTTTQQRCNYNIQQCEVRLVRDPLLIPKQEIGRYKSSSSTITIAATRQTVAEVFIEALSSSPRASAKYKYVKPTGHERENARKETDDNQDDSCDLFNDTFDNDGDEDTESVSVENAEIRTGQKENNNDNVNPILQNKYRCRICDDVCADKFEFKHHLEFHLELHQDNDKHTIITQRNTVAKIVGSPENSSQAAEAIPNITSVPTDETTNPKRDDVTQTAVIEIPSSTEHSLISKSSQAVEEISSSSLLLTGGDASKVVPVEIPSVPNAAVKSGSSKSQRKKAAAALFATQKANLLKALTENQKLPRIPIRECECRLKKLDTKCESCKKRPKYVCGNCKMEFKSYPKLKEHVTNAHKSAKYFCPECGRGYDRTSILKQHIDRHKGLFACYLCTSSFKTHQQLEQHIITHRIKCDQCDKICVSKKELSSHKLEVHKGVSYTCGDCNKTFNKYDLLKSHNTRHHRTGEYKCKVCGKMYTRLITYKEHIYRHRKEKQVICEECGKEFRSVLYLKTHQNRIHLKKKYICNVCKKEFSTMTGRTNCQNKHAGIAKYKCDMCDKAYFYDGSLIIHKRIHTGEKPYICFVCSRRFYSNQMLLKHCLSHGILEKEIKKRMKGAYQPEKQK